jgi:ABC-2 type transport system ATP-binding protein
VHSKLSRIVVTGAAVLFAAVAAPAVAGAVTVEKDRVATSFDGTKIVYTEMLPDGASTSNPVPAVMMTHGWGGTGQDTPDGFAGELLDHGYAVLTWDERGFGDSGGNAEIDDPRYEARDAHVLVNVLARDPRIAQDGPGDPTVGMTGGSYAGGIQWITAARDPRIDAITPQISWHNLLQSLIPKGVIKLGWDVLLYGDGAATTASGGILPPNPAGPQLGSYDPMIHRSFVEGSATGNFSAATRRWFLEKGPYYLLHKVNVPTFIIQGSVDTLFPPSQGIENYESMLRKHPEQPLKMDFYCGGHGTCSPYDSGPSGYLDNEIIAWFDRYLKGDTSVDTGPKVEYITQDGVWHGASAWPVPGTTTRSASGHGLVAINGGPTESGLMSGSQAPASLDIPIPSDPGTLAGRPRVAVTESGVGTATDEPLQATLFFQVVDTTTGNVLGNQVTPEVFRTDGQTHTYRFDIEPVFYAVPPGDHLALEVASTSLFYEAYRGAAIVNLKNVSVKIPQVG